MNQRSVKNGYEIPTDGIRIVADKLRDQLLDLAVLDTFSKALKGTHD